MANGKYETVEIRFVLEPEITHAYALLKEIHDCPLGVQGWHHKAFPASKTAADILQEMFTTDNCVLWPHNAPKE